MTSFYPRLKFWLIKIVSLLPFRSRNPFAFGLPKWYFLVWAFVWFVVALTIERAVYLLWNHDLLANASVTQLVFGFSSGFIFDASASSLTLLALLIPYLLVRQKWGLQLLLALFLGLTATGLILNWIDLELVRFTARRTARDGIFLFSEGNWRVLDILTQYGLLVITGLLYLTLIYYFLWLGIKYIARWSHVKNPTPLTIWRFVGLIGLWGLTFLALIWFARGGGPSRAMPLEAVDAPPIPQVDLLALNTPFVFYKSMANPTVKRRNFFAKESEVLEALRPKSSIPHWTIGPPPKNVVVLIMESMSYGFMGKRNGVKGFTPFLV